MLSFTDVADSVGKVKRGSRLRFTSPVVGWLFWLTNVLAFAGLCTWILIDGQFSQALWSLPGEYFQRFAGEFNGNSSQSATRARFLEMLGALALGSAMGIFSSLLLGARTHRGVRSWLGFTVLVAAWLTLAVSWRDLAWHSQALRMKWRLSGLDSVADSLLTDWPAADGEHPVIGPFVAYPHGAPSMLLLLTTPEIGHAGVEISAIERSATTDGLRFQLTGNEWGPWLEWHPPGSVPESFRGGLMTQYQLERAANLADGWFLARYRESY
jgi:hypothetical protein